MAKSLSDQIVALRPARNVLDPWRPYAFSVEEEIGPGGEPVDVATVFLTNRECPFRCVMCDLWRNTLEETVPPGAIPEQVRWALSQLPPVRHVKLYNAGSFFDSRAIPPSDYSAIGSEVAHCERVIVECHPGFLGERCLEFRDLFSGKLEVAMGLETAHPDVLARLNKRMTLDDFRAGAEFLRSHDIALRVFILVRPPWLSEAEGVEWACRSLDFAFECGATLCALIPTRAGNGYMEMLAKRGEFAPPSLASVEAALEYGLSLRKGRVLADPWDLEQFASCRQCSAARIERLKRMNATQTIQPPVRCETCGGSA